MRTCVRAVEEKGAIAEIKIAAAAVELGVPVLRPMQEHGRYDLAFEIAGELLRVQCKWGHFDAHGRVVKVNLTSSWCTPTGYGRRTYGVGEIDLVAVYSGGSAVATFWRPKVSLAVAPSG
jgi:PD-(D/E)XK endonuclease